MKKLRSRFELFCLRNRNKGIPNLMLYIAIGSAIVYLMSFWDESNTLYRVLCFDRDAILHGQVWRLFTYAFTYDGGNLLFTAISLLCYYYLGTAIERSWGVCKFNLFYLTGLLLMDVFGLLFYMPDSAYSLNLSLFLAYATLFSDSVILFELFIPIKARILALVNLALTVVDIVQLLLLGLPFPIFLYPLVAIANYFLFFGKDVVNVLPPSWRIRMRRSGHSPKKTGTVRYRAPAPDAVAYTHRCTVCGRTNVSNPELEFRYCSRCNGYYCYCQDHINDHTHIH